MWERFARADVSASQVRTEGFSGVFAGLFKVIRLRAANQGKLRTLSAQISRGFTSPKVFGLHLTECVLYFWAQL